MTYAFADAPPFDGYVRVADEGPAVILLDSTIADLPDVINFTTSIATEHPAGCAALIVDGQSAAPCQRRNARTVYTMMAFPAERWPPIPVWWQIYTRRNGLPTLIAGLRL